MKRVSILADDKEMQTKISVVQRIGSGLPALLYRLRQVDVGDKLESAHFLLSTAHKAKGLEFPTVLLWDDFADVSRVIDASGDGSAFSYLVHDGMQFVEQTVGGDEVNLVYVAATRAMKRLIVYKGLARLHSGRSRAWPGPRGGGGLRRGGPGTTAVLRPLRLSVPVGGSGGGGDSDGGGGESSRFRKVSPYEIDDDILLETCNVFVGPTECLGCERPAREVALGGCGGGGGGSDWRRDAGIAAASSSATYVEATLGLAVMARRDPVSARRAAALGFHQSAGTTGQWWGASRDVAGGYTGRMAHAAYQRRGALRKESTGMCSLTAPACGAWATWVCWRCVENVCLAGGDGDEGAYSYGGDGAGVGGEDGGDGGGEGGGEAAAREEEREEREYQRKMICDAVGPASFFSLRDLARMIAAEREARRVS